MAADTKIEWADGSGHEEPQTCWNCGGEGFVFECFDGQCRGAEEGCDDCTVPCDVCAGRVLDGREHSEMPGGGNANRS